jgi:murein DD-endopeptidase MepM/ murein hydrolase activator NlpD
LRRSLANQQDVKRQQEDLKNLINSQLGYTSELSKQSEAEYSKSKREIDELNKKQRDYENTLNGSGINISAEEVAAIQAIEQRKLRNQGPGYIPPAASGCPVEADNLKVEPNELAPVTSGIIRKLFVCPGGYSGHDGVDISNDTGTPIYSAGNGVVISRCINYSASNCMGGLGYHLAIRTELKSGQTFIAVYGHMSKLDVGEGQRVTRGQRIGLMGNTGNSYGAHLHFIMTVTGSAQIGCNSYRAAAANTKCYNPLRYIPNLNLAN